MKDPATRAARLDQDGSVMTPAGARSKRRAPLLPSIASMNMTTGSGQNRNAVLENLDLHGNYDEVPVPAEVRDVQQYIDRCAQSLSSLPGFRG